MAPEEGSRMSTSFSRFSSRFPLLPLLFLSTPQVRPSHLGPLTHSPQPTFQSPPSAQLFISSLGSIPACVCVCAHVFTRVCSSSLGWGRGGEGSKQAWQCSGLYSWFCAQKSPLTVLRGPHVVSGLNPRSAGPQYTSFLIPSSAFGHPGYF